MPNIHKCPDYLDVDYCASTCSGLWEKRPDLKKEPGCKHFKECYPDVDPVKIYLEQK